MSIMNCIREERESYDL